MRDPSQLQQAKHLDEAATEAGSEGMDGEHTSSAAEVAFKEATDRFFGGGGDDDGDDDADAKARRKQQRSLSQHSTSDALARLRALGAYLHSFPEESGAAASKRQQLLSNAAEKTMNSSAALTAAAAANAALAAKKREFCASVGIHEPTMARMALVYAQLLRLLKQRFSSGTPARGVGETAATNKKTKRREAEAFQRLLGKGNGPPSKGEEALLRQVILSASLDCVARLAPPGTVTAGSRLDRHCAYISCNPALAGVALYLHPTSCLFDPAALRHEHELGHCLAQALGRLARQELTSG